MVNQQISIVDIRHSKKETDTRQTDADADVSRPLNISNTIELDLFHTWFQGTCLHALNILI